jgi:hypothetical protein
VGGPTLTCRLFGLPPERAFDVAASRETHGGGAFIHTITVRKGAGTKTTPAGTLVVTSK